MAKVTSKLQVTVPKAIAEQFGIRPGDDIQWIPAGDAVRVQKGTPQARGATAPDIARRLELFDRATERQREHQKKAKRAHQKAKRAHPKTGERGWRREDVYERGHAR